MDGMKPSDAPYKVLLQDRGLFEEIVRLVAPRLAAELDFESIVALDKEHLAATGRTRLQDKVYRVAWRELYRDRPSLLVLLEFQSSNDPDMALRMEEYAHLAATGSVESDEANRPPEVLAIVVHNGERPWRASAEGLVLRTSDERPTRPAYATVDLPLLAEELDDRVPADSRLGTLTRLESVASSLLPRLLAEAFQRYAGPESTALRRGLHLRATAILRRQGMANALPPLDECERLLRDGRGETMRTMADANFDRWREENVAQGVKQGMAQGVKQGAAQGRIALLGRLAARRFGASVAGRVTALLADVSDTSRLDAAGEWLVDCETGEALLERLPAIARGAGNGTPD